METYKINLKQDIILNGEEIGELNAFTTHAIINLKLDALQAVGAKRVQYCKAIELLQNGQVIASKRGSEIVQDIITNPTLFLQLYNVI